MLENIKLNFDPSIFFNIFLPFYSPTEEGTDVDVDRYKALGG